MTNPIYPLILPAPKAGGYREENYYIWCGSCIRGEDGRYHLFASRWKKELGFGVHWLFNCEIVRAASDAPEGPYHYEETVLGRRDRSYFDGMNQHNPHIKYYNGTYYLYYMGTTYGGLFQDQTISSRLNAGLRSGTIKESVWPLQALYSGLGVVKIRLCWSRVWDNGTERLLLIPQ